MKVTWRRLASIVAVLVASVTGAQEAGAAAAACPTECRAERAEVICQTLEVLKNGEWVVIEVRYWSNGPM